MTQTTFSSFDPLATHPFTNNSGLLPKPTPPSQFPHPIPSSLRRTTADAAPGQVHPLPPPSLHTPQPKLPTTTAKSHSKSNAPRPIFVPFRPERSSPELDDILLRKKVSDVLMNKDTWSIDQLKLPLQNGVSSSIATNGVQGGKTR